MAHIDYGEASANVMDIHGIGLHSPGIAIRMALYSAPEVVLCNKMTHCGPAIDVYQFSMVTVASILKKHPIFKMIKAVEDNASYKALVERTPCTNIGDPSRGSWISLMMLPLMMLLKTFCSTV